VLHPFGIGTTALSPGAALLALLLGAVLAPRPSRSRPSPAPRTAMVLLRGLFGARLS